MAKRKRLLAPRPNIFATDPVPEGNLSPASAIRAPISQVAGEVAVTAAFEEVQAELKAAQREGRMVLSLPLAVIRQDYLIRDRLSCDPEELAALKESLRARGQQSPIEVTDLGKGHYGLISGWRRVRALRELSEESGGLQRYGVVQALLRLPADRPAAYVAMVEENEIRADLSFYERARIVVQAVKAEVFDSDKQALQTLFSTASFSKRSKVKSFMPLVEHLDDALRYPAQIPEKLGLALSKALVADPGFAQRLNSALQAAVDLSPEAERGLLEQSLQAPAAGGDDLSAATKITPAKINPANPPLSKPQAVGQGFQLRTGVGRVEIAGDGLTEELVERLKLWLEAQD